jgi:hypothetical protein
VYEVSDRPIQEGISNIACIFNASMSSTTGYYFRMLEPDALDIDLLKDKQVILENGDITLRTERFGGLQHGPQENTIAFWYCTQHLPQDIVMAVSAIAQETITPLAISSSSL